MVTQALSVQVFCDFILPLTFQRQGYLGMVVYLFIVLQLKKNL